MEPCANRRGALGTAENERLSFVEPMILPVQQTNHNNTSHKQTRSVSSTEQLNLKMQDVATKILEEQNNRLKQELEVTSREKDAIQDGMDEVVTDLLAAQAELAAERQRTADKDGEIAQLRDYVTQLVGDVDEKEGQLKALQQKYDQINGDGLQAPEAKAVSELRRLLAFHKSNGEQTSRQTRDLQETNRKLEVALQHKSELLNEQNRLIAALRLHAE